MPISGCSWCVESWLGMGCAPRQSSYVQLLCDCSLLSQERYEPLVALLQYASRGGSPSSSNSTSPGSPAVDYRDLNCRVQNSTARVRRLLNGGTVDAVSPSASQFFSPQEGSPSSGWGTPDHQFNQLDTDSDGVISREEFAASGAVRTTLYEQFKGHTTPPAVAARPPTSVSDSTSDGADIQVTRCIGVLSYTECVCNVESARRDACHTAGCYRQASGRPACC
jgi:hypothetical protein